MKIDSVDFGILLDMYFDRSTTSMLESLAYDARKRIYRLSRHGLCSCDGVDRPPRRWSVSLEGAAFVEKIGDEQGQAWRDQGWHTEWKRS